MRHRAVGFDARVAVAKPRDVRKILLAREQRAAAHAAVRIGRLGGQTAGQLGDDPLGNLLALVGIDVAEHHDVREEHAPVIVEAHQQPIPVERRPELADEVHHVGAVEALALLHKALRPNHLLRGTQLHGDVEEPGVDRVREPEIVDARDAVAGAEDDVDEMMAAVDLPQPMRERQLGAIPERVEDSEHLTAVFRPHEDVEVLGVALNFCVFGEREGAADEIRHARFVEPLQGPGVKRLGRLVDDARGTRVHAVARAYSRRPSGPTTANCGTSVARRPVGAGAGSSTVTSKTRNGGRSANVRVRSGIETL